jgi:hypothetical protein
MHSKDAGVSSWDGRYKAQGDEQLENSRFASEDTQLSRHRSLSYILQLLQETEAERVRADQERQDPSTRDLGELRMQLVRDRHKLLGLLKRQKDPNSSY